MFETQRLQVRPLSAQELHLLASSPLVFAEQLRLAPSVSLSDAETCEAIRNDLLPNVANPANDFRFYTMWIIIAKEDRAIVGGLCFHGAPNDAGEVEVGYGIDEEYQNRGFMTEALNGLIAWLKANTDVKTLLAETEPSNAASVKVLENTGFDKAGDRNGNLLLSNNLL